MALWTVHPLIHVTQLGENIFPKRIQPPPPSAPLAQPEQSPAKPTLNKDFPGGQIYLTHC
jgi:hypothetical protein